ncbi:hypothetical protein [Microcystis phage Mel-JY34]
MFAITLVREPLDAYRNRLATILDGLQSLNPESDAQRRHRDALFDAIDVARESGAQRPITELRVEKALARADGSPRLFIRTPSGIESIRISA